MNEQHVLRVLQGRGPLSRAEVARHTGLTAPTVSKAVASLLQAGLLEEADLADLTGGRPAKKLRLANQTAQVLGVVIDAGHCQVVSAGLDGKLHDDARSVPTPDSYEGLLDSLTAASRPLMDRPGVTTLGVGLSLPGLIDYRQQRGVLSPNVPVTDGRSPGLDLGRRLGVECVMLQESHALCLAERHYGAARGLDDFAMLDVSTGVGLGVMSGGRLLTGHSGLAGEIGHITVVANGRRCGCGNRGCLETVAGDSALAHRVSRRLRRKVAVDEVIDLARAGKLALGDDLRRTCHYLAVGVAAVINLFNPATLFVHGRLFEADDGLFNRLVRAARRRALPPSFADCRIVQARGSKRLGAVAAAVHRLTQSLAPTLENNSVYFPAEVQGA
jgi:N-acetylglucosamine repressor